MKTKKPKIFYSKEWLSEEEIEHMLKARISLFEKAILHILYGGALRVNELCTLKVSDINFKIGTMTLWRSKASSSPEVIPVSPKFLKPLDKYIKSKNLDKTSYIFKGYHKDKPITTTAIYYMVDRIAKQCKITKKLGTHSLRRSRATHCLDKGIPMEEVSKFLRHKNLATTMVYLKISVDKLRQSLRKIDE